MALPGDPAGMTKLYVKRRRSLVVLSKAQYERAQYGAGDSGITVFLNKWGGDGARVDPAGGRFTALHSGRFTTL